MDLNRYRLSTDFLHISVYGFIPDGEPGQRMHSVAVITGPQQSMPPLIITDKKPLAFSSPKQNLLLAELSAAKLALERSSELGVNSLTRIHTGNKFLVRMWNTKAPRARQEAIHDMPAGELKEICSYLASAQLKRSKTEITTKPLHFRPNFPHYIAIRAHKAFRAEERSSVVALDNYRL